MSISTCPIDPVIRVAATCPSPGRPDSCPRQGAISRKAFTAPADRPQPARRGPAYWSPASRVLTPDAGPTGRAPRFAPDLSLGAGRSGVGLVSRRCPEKPPPTATQADPGRAARAGLGGDFAAAHLHMRRTQRRRHGRGRPSARAPEARARVTQFDGQGKASYREALIDPTSTGPIAQSVRAAGS